jgi:hypothetical protein
VAKAQKRVSKLPKLYKFILNPYSDARFTRCPKCEGKTRQKKLPLVIHVAPLFPLVLNKTCRYCPGCDILIAHQDELESLLVAMFEQRAPEAIGNDYLVLGTFSRADWRRGVKDPYLVKEMLDHLHEFKAYLTVEPSSYGWVREEDAKGD